MGPWTLTHLYQIAPTFLILALLSIFSAKMLDKRKLEHKYAPLQMIATILVVLEIAKQINAYTNSESYNLYALPFHYCSLFLYLLPFHAFYHGRRRYIADAVSFGCLASLMLFMILMPTVVYTDDNIKNFFTSFEDFHTVIFHNLIVLYFMLTLALKLYEFNTKRDLTIIGIFLTVYVVIAAILAYSLKTNFHNLYRCNIGFIENVRLELIARLEIFGTLIYVTALYIVTVLFTFASYSLARLFIKHTRKYET